MLVFGLSRLFAWTTFGVCKYKCYQYQQRSHSRLSTWVSLVKLGSLRRRKSRVSPLYILGGVAGFLTFIARSIRKNAIPKITRDRKSTRLNSSHLVISYAVFCLKKKKEKVSSP